MRVGIDARELVGRPTGVGRYLRELLVRWQAAPACAGVELVLFTPTPALSIDSPLGTGGAHLTTQVVPGAAGTMWEQRDLARAVAAARVDALFSPAYTTPLRVRTPIVLAVHDVSYAAHPEWYAWRHGLRLRWLSRWSAARASVVLTLTDFSASEIRRHLGVPAERLRVIPLAVDYHDAPPRPSVPAAARPTVLFVGSIFERRHLPMLIEAVALARRRVPALRLEVIGENRTAPRQDLVGMAADHGIADAIGLRDYVSDAELESAYATAGVFAFLSEYEGFGLTPLEAMRHRVPTVVLDTPVAREVYRAGARYVPLGNVDDLANELATLLTDGPARERQVAAGDEVVAHYRWAEAAEATWRAITDAAGGAR